MSGHSKWANIKHKKEKTDSQRGKVFTKIGRELAAVVREGGGDPVSNTRLRDVIAKAKASNVPNDTIERAIKKAAGELGDVVYEHITYEGYAPGGVAVIVECLTENRNRTASDVRHYFDKCGGSLGTTGCVGYMFDRRGILVVERSAMDPDQLMEMAVEAGASDFAEMDEVYEITTDPSDFSAVRDALAQSGISFLSAEIEMIPQNTAKPEGENLESVLKMIGLLDDLDDVQNVYHNAELPEEPEED